MIVAEMFTLFSSRPSRALACGAVVAVSIACGSSPRRSSSSSSFEVSPTVVTLHRRPWRVGDARRAEITRTVDDGKSIDLHLVVHEEVVAIDAVARGRRIALRVTVEGCDSKKGLKCPDSPLDLKLVRGEPEDDETRRSIVAIDFGQFREMVDDAETELPQGPLRVGSSVGGLFALVDDQLHASPVGASDAPTFDGRLAAIEQRDGRVRAVFELGAESVNDVAEPKGRTTTEISGTLVVDAQTGRYVESTMDGHSDFSPSKVVAASPPSRTTWRTHIVWSNGP